MKHLSEILLSPGSPATSILVLAFLIGFYLTLSQGVYKLTKTHWLSPTMSGRIKVLLRWSFFGALIVLILQEIGVITEAWAIFFTAAVALAVAFFAQWSILSNGVCALIIIIYRRFSIGSVIEILEGSDKPEGIKGYVSDINLMFTELEESDGNKIQIPNTLFFQKITRVYPTK